MTKIINNKTIASLALIFITIEAVPIIGANPNPVIFTKVVLWIFGAIFVWLNKGWASIFLGCLAIAYVILDIILPIWRLISTLQTLPSTQTLHHQYIPYMIILSMIIEIAFLFCFIYFGALYLYKRFKLK